MNAGSVFLISDPGRITAQYHHLPTPFGRGTPPLKRRRKL
jgi:hypothetical protein